MHASQWGRERKRKVISWSQVTTTNQFSYLPYQQSLLAYNKQVNIELVTWLPTLQLAAAVHAVEQVANGGDQARAEECRTEAKVSRL